MLRSSPLAVSLKSVSPVTIAEMAASQVSASVQISAVRTSATVSQVSSWRSSATVVAADHHVDHDRMQRVAEPRAVEEVLEQLPGPAERTDRRRP